MSSSCTACPLHENALNVCVRSRGTGEILVVGQNPGAEEDFSGEAFVGKSGQLLDAMLADAGFDPAADVRRTNVVRCITPGNRPPLPNEIAACAQYLLDEIDEVRPAAIIAMGDVAFKALTGLRSALSAKRGQSFPHRDRSEIEVWPTWHPAFVLRTPMARATVVSDLRRVRDRHTTAEEIPWVYDDTLDRLLGDTMAYDIETYDENGKITDEPTQIAFCSDTNLAIVSNDRSAVPGMIEQAQLAAEFCTVIVSHNGTEFDDLKTGIRSDYDTRALFHLIDETQPLGLESLAVKYLGVRGWKEDQRGVLGDNLLAEYNARDAVMTLRLFRVAREELGDRIKLYEEITRPARWALDAASKRGIWINPETVERHRVRIAADLEARHAAVLEAVGATGFSEDAFDVQLKTKVKKVPFNPNSNAHVGRVLEEHLGFRLPRTPSGEPAVGRDQLVYIDHPVAAAILDYREVAKKMSTYVLPYAEIAASGDGRAHTTYKLSSTDTTRSSSSKPNTQNIDRSLQDIKDAPPGRVLTSADYAAVEFRMGAFIADERTIIEEFQNNPNWDPHTWFACRLYDKTPEEIKADAAAKKEAGLEDSMRQIAKSANFSQEFDGTGETLRAYAAREMGIFLPSAEAHRTHLAWHAAFTGWKPWYDRVWEEFVKNGYVESPTGRRRHIGDVNLLNREGRADARRQLVNFKVQSFCADIAMLALRFCHEAGLPIVDFVHDDIKFEFDSMQQAEQAETLIKFCMVDKPLWVLRETFGVVPNVPLVVEIKHKAGLQAVAE